MAEELELPEALSKHVKKLTKPVTSEDVDSYAKLQGVRDRSHRLRAIVRAWKDQQAQERKMRARYASLLIWGMGVQLLFINAVMILIGRKALMFEPWVAQTFIVSVFAEITALVLIVVKYLFRGPDGSILSPELRSKRGVRRERD